MRQYVLIVSEDEQGFRDELARLLQEQGCGVRVAGDAEQGIECAGETSPDLIVIDLPLKGMHRADICRRLQTDSRTLSIPFIIVSFEDTEVDRIVGFELGATDVISKHVTTREVLLKLRAVLRRLKFVRRPEISQVGPLVIDRSSYQVKTEVGHVSVTPSEFRLLDALISAEGKALGRTQLMASAWKDDQHEASERCVDVHVMRLRKKLGDVGAMIETVRGIGYRLSKEEFMRQRAEPMVTALHGL